MIALNKFALLLGASFVIIGGTSLVFVLTALVLYAACMAWIHASNRFRDVCKAESLIHEYRRNREKFLKWLEAEGKNEQRTY